MNGQNRKDIQRNHTATHILHKVLREKLGTHVEQSGSLVDNEKLRFDFSHFESISREVLDEIEKEVNDIILTNIPVIIGYENIQTAKDRGAMALFSDKYGDIVRVVEMPGFSIELCGGTHVESTGEIGLFNIESENGISSGVRRIVATTGHRSLNYVNNIEEKLEIISSLLKTDENNVVEIVKKYISEAKEAHKDIPKALLYCIPTLMVVYGGVAIVASGVLPLDQVAGQPLTLVAKNILNPALFTVFMIGGPVLALSSSINSTISNNCIPVAQSCKDGWLPKSWAAQNRRGAYWKLMTFTYLMGILPVLLDFSISDVVNNIMLLASALAFLQIYAYFQLPKKHAEAWEKSPMHISNGKYYFLCCLSLFAYICIFINSCRSLKLPVVIISLIAIVVCMAYGWFRSVSPDVKMETSVWED